MDANSWSGRLISTSKRYQSAALQSRSGLYNGFEEIDVDEETRAEFPCPFCDEDFDIIGLCCHIDDEHPVEAKNGECPVCGTRVGMDMVGHRATQHGQYFKMQRKRRFHKGGTQSNLSLLRKELRDGNLQAFFSGSNMVSSSNAEPDPLLSSFIYNLPMIDEIENVKPPSTAKSDSVTVSSDENMLERNAQPAPLSDKDQEEKAIRSEFAQALVLSTMFGDIL